MKPTIPQIIEALPHVRYEIESLLQTPEHDPCNEALVESVEFRRMAHARVLYTFFTRPISKRQEKDPNDDDVLSEDYGFTAESLYGVNPKPLLDRFNKDLFHLTYTRLERTAQTKRWPREQLLPPVEAQSRKFIDYIIQNRMISVPDGKAVSIADEEHNCWRELKRTDVCRLPLQQRTSNIAAPIIGITRST